MLANFNQLSMTDIYSTVGRSKSYLTLPILKIGFENHFPVSTGSPQKYQFYAMISALILQRIFSIPTDTLLIIFLKYLQELREFCGFLKVSTSFYRTLLFILNA